MKVNLNTIGTEQINENSKDIDLKSTYEILKTINKEDMLVPVAVGKELKNIERVVDLAVKAIDSGGRVIYMGAGTSGRIGILDAVECRPTFSAPDEMIQCLMAGGEKAFIRAQEGAEDSKELAVSDLQKLNLSKNDLVIGITASGRTPYAVGGVEYAKKVGAKTASISTSKDSVIASLVDAPVVAVTGEEVITGSTRMKSGTAQKLICNMISTTTMIKLGKVYSNLMVDVQPTNEKLVERAKRIVTLITSCSYEEAEKYLLSHKTVKSAVLGIVKKLDKAEADKLLLKHKGNLRSALNG